MVTSNSLAVLTQVASVKDIDLCCLGNELAEVALEQLAGGTLAVSGLYWGLAKCVHSAPRAVRGLPDSMQCLPCQQK